MRAMISYSSDPPDPDAYLRLFETTGWNEIYSQTAEALWGALNASWFVVFAQEGEALVGAGRLVSDGVQYAVIFDMVVAPSHQGRGIGSEILRRILARCDEAEIRDVLLFAATGTAEFYAQHGFEPRPMIAPGMIRRRRFG